MEDYNKSGISINDWATEYFKFSVSGNILSNISFNKEKSPMSFT